LKLKQNHATISITVFCPITADEFLEHIDSVDDETTTSA